MTLRQGATKKDARIWLFGEHVTIEIGTFSSLLTFDRVYSRYEIIHSQPPMLPQMSCISGAGLCQEGYNSHCTDKS